MRFIDMNDDRIYSVADLWKDWKAFKDEDPENHAETFTAELLEIILATINGRNDLKIIDATPREISHLADALVRATR